MLLTLFIIAILLFPLIARGQNNVIETVPYHAAVQKPSFQGGDIDNFSKWVKANLVYPESAKKNNVEGIVYLNFIVDIDGSIRDVKVICGIDPDIDREAKRVVSSSPKWVPGKDSNGKPIRVLRSNFPVSFLKKVNTQNSLKNGQSAKPKNNPNNGQSAKPNSTPVGSVQALYSAFSDNEVAARRKYLNQTYQINDDYIYDFAYIDDAPVIMFRCWVGTSSHGKMMPVVYCHFPIQEEAAVAECHKGQKVTIRGYVYKYQSGLVHIKNCTFVKQKHTDRRDNSYISNDLRIMVNLFTFLALILVMGTNTHRISSVETRDGWIYYYDESGRKYKTLSASSVGEVKGYSSTFMVTIKDRWLYLYDSEGKKYHTMSTTTTGEVIGVAGDTFTTRNSGWIYTWDRNGKKINTRPAR